MSKPSDSTRYDTIVIGAGVAGVTAARLLAGAGQRVVVLEARDRVGGRLHTLREGGRIIDHGASWIHGIDDCPLYDVARGLELPMQEFTMGSYQVDGRPLTYFGPDGERLDASAAAGFAGDVHALDAVLVGVIEESSTGASWAEVVDQGIAELGWSGSRADRVREYLHHRSEEQCGAEARDLGAHGLDDDVIDGDEVVFPRGYDELATRLAESLDIRLSHRVSDVRWSPDGATVRATTADGVAEFSGDRVVVTVPVGVLKSGAFSFDPPLEDPVASALEGFEMNAFEKVFLRFSERFWDEGVYGVRRLGPAGRNWHSWYDLSALSGEPTLLTFAAGDWAREVRGMSDAEIAESVVARLQEIYGVAVTAPTHVHVTRWQDDPFTHGSYSFMTTRSRTDDHDRLAEPLGGGVLQIAGEATSTEHSATVTGAMITGHRAAERILGRPVAYEELLVRLPE